MFSSLFFFNELHNQVMKAWNESTLNRILQLTEEANSNKPKIQRWLDEFGEIYSKVVVVLSVSIAFLGPVFFKWPFLSTIGMYTSPFLLFLNGVLTYFKVPKNG